MRIALLVAVFAVVSGCSRPPASAPASTPVIQIVMRSPSTAPEDVLGRQPPDWLVSEWINSAGLQLAELRGKVVLVRWFTGNWCEDCSATAPALRHFDKTYRDLGLLVVGIFHNSDGSSRDEIAKIVKGYDYSFPVAIDRKTKTRKAWCQGSDGWATSVTFLLDRSGTIRHIHPGGRYVKGDSDYAMMQSKIEELLSEPAPHVIDKPL